MPAGELRERVSFQKRGATSDIYGNTQTGDFEEQFVVAARIRPRLGGEQVMAARLAGTQPVTITVRWSAQTKTIAPEWRARDARTGTIYNIRSIVNPDEKHRYIDVLAEAGVAV